MNHYIHHAVNTRYVDRNYGGVIMLWDKLFGTWAEESGDEPCIFGVRKPYRSWDPIFAHVDWWARLWKDAVNTQRWRDKIKLWFMPTGWRPADVEESDPWQPYDIENYKKYDPDASFWNKAFAVALFLATLPLISHLLVEQFNLSVWEKAGLAGVILTCLYTCAYLLQGSRKQACNEAPEKAGY